MSCEPGRKAPYSLDLGTEYFGRDSVWNCISDQLNLNTCISIGTAYNMCNTFQQTGNLDPKKQVPLNAHI